MARAIATLAATLHARMRRERVRFVFLVGYYDVAGYAYVLAAARAGALSIDVQHGVTGDQHMGYARWQRPVQAGLKLLPGCFWTWTDADAQTVRGWADRHTPRRHAVVGGHPFLDLWRRGEMRLTPATTEALDALLVRSPERPRVLVTLQPNAVSDEMLAPLLAAWQRRPQASWWLRLHPLAGADRPRIEALLCAHGVAHWDIDAASALPLPALLTHTDVHATHSSSAVIEAELMGVPSIVWSAYGAELVPDALARGSVSLALDGETFASGLRSLAARPAGAAAASPNTTVDAVRAVLELAT
ncbi:hypothetical protein PLCT1_01436 [Planctomycetaceae bacterium]|nr:hypothetical protein PLCT1_01436 [Planctomycetaceae bacterium]